MAVQAAETTVKTATDRGLGAKLDHRLDVMGAGGTMRQAGASSSGGGNSKVRLT
jgi:hypothetical protein